jgi:hypothetical protein
VKVFYLFENGIYFVCLYRVVLNKVDERRGFNIHKSNATQGVGDFHAGLSHSSRSWLTYACASVPSYR